MFAYFIDLLNCCCSCCRCCGRCCCCCSFAQKFTFVCNFPHISLSHTFFSCAALFLFALVSVAVATFYGFPWKLPQQLSSSMENQTVALSPNTRFELRKQNNKNTNLFSFFWLGLGNVFKFEPRTLLEQKAAQFACSCSSSWPPIGGTLCCHIYQLITARMLTTVSCCIE